MKNQKLFAVKTRKIANISNKRKQIKTSTVSGRFLIKSIELCVYIINENWLITEYLVKFFEFDVYLRG